MIMEVDNDALSLEASSQSSLEGDEGGSEEVSSTSVFAFSPADQELLVRLVKLAQKRAYTTKHGIWPDYLAKTFTQTQPRDPARHPWNVLADFIEAIDDKQVQQEIQVFVSWERKVEEETELTGAAAESSLDGPPEGSIWHLVTRTAMHPRFEDNYRFQQDSTWTRIRSIPAYDQEPTLLAVDCEMCVIENDDKALLSLCAVDMAGERVMHELVVPEGPVKDFKTAITGHTAADLEGLTYSRDAAKRDLLQHLHSSSNVVLVGHALHHDLKALHLDYQPVIDTSLLLPYKDMPNAAPPLTDLVSRLLGRQLRQEGAPHDVTADAHASMDLALYEHQKGPTPPLEAPVVEVSDDDKKRLLVHAMPVGMRDVDVIFLFPPGCPPISDIQRESKGATKAFVTFGSPTDAEAAFDMLDGRAGLDSRGRAQKLVKIPSAPDLKNKQVRIRVLHFDPVKSGKDCKLPQSVGCKRKFADQSMRC